MKLEATKIEQFQPSKLPQEISVIYFYPRDNTPGCTKESEDFCANFKKFEKLGVAIYGVSADSMTSHEKFSAKLDLPFALVSDPNSELCEKFGVIKMKSMYGKKFKGIERSTFIVNSKGKILKEWRGVKVPGHVAEVLASLKEFV